ncbi:MAG: hypothetical protein JNJ70_09540 [Verrucomicrobiales bacterium]|nr:hypothetical protein [Verrucomicrobiales bacterium]
MRKAESDPAISDYSIIGHSHGGTVIWLALLLSHANEGVRLSKLYRWLTVGTPFFWHNEMKLNEQVATNACRADYEAHWRGFCHEEDEALALLRAACKTLSDSSSQWNVAFNSLVVSGISRWLFNHFISGVVFGARGVKKVSEIPIGFDRRIISEGKTYKNLKKKSIDEFRICAPNDFKEFREFLAERPGSTMPEGKTVDCLIHCLYFGSHELRSSIIRRLKPPISPDSIP